MFHDKIRTTDLDGVYERVTWKYWCCCGLYFCGGFWFVCFGFFSPKGKNFYVRVECIGSLCCTKLCLVGWGALNMYLLPRAAGKLVFHSCFCENCFWYPYSSVGLWGSQECSLSSCAWNGVILVGSPPLSLSSPCCSSLFSTHAQSTCFVFPLLNSCFLASVLN